LKIIEKEVSKMSVVKIEGKNDQNKVFLYTLSTCGWCKKTKAYLKENEIAFEYLDLDKCTKEEQREAISVLKKKNIPVAFPVIMINDDKIISGFRKNDIAEALSL
jgi:glutaredoxin